MSATAEAKARTRAFARVIGPFLLIVPTVIVARAPDMGGMVSAFFANDALIWVSGALMLFAGLLIIARHQYWSSVPAVMVSLFGWFLGLRGLALLMAPHVYEQFVAAFVGSQPLLWLTFGALVLVGLRLTYEGWIARLASAPEAVGYSA